jgi:hypothetical protein
VLDYVIIIIIIIIIIIGSTTLRGPWPSSEASASFPFHCFIPPILHSQILNILDHIIFPSQIIPLALLDYVPLIIGLATLTSDQLRCILDQRSTVETLCSSESLVCVPTILPYIVSQESDTHFFAVARTSNLIIPKSVTGVYKRQLKLWVFCMIVAADPCARLWSRPFSEGLATLMGASHALF